MRVLLVNQFGHRIGGIEIYLQSLVPALLERGHDVAFLHEHPLPPGAEPIAPASVPRWDLQTSSVRDSLDPVRAWKPDVVFVHQPIAAPHFGSLHREWPSVYFAHSYAGVCISGSKCWSFPGPPQPCQRVLGWACLAHYLPHRCGGKNPFVAWRLFHQQRAIQSELRGFQILATHSDYVLDEYRRHGFDASRLVKVPFWVPGRRDPPPPEPRRLQPGEPRRILFLGRFETVKGGGLLLDALPEVIRGLGLPVHVTFAGDGPMAAAWRERGESLSRTVPGLQVHFPGWLDRWRRAEALVHADVLAVPSAWPEPFGMTGVEAASEGLPVVAFDVGGVREWLTEGVNGHLAAGRPVHVRDLADALVRTLADAAHHTQLSKGALGFASRFGREPHLDHLDSVFARCRSAFRPGTA